MTSTSDPSPRGLAFCLFLLDKYLIVPYIGSMFKKLWKKVKRAAVKYGPELVKRLLKKYAPR